MEDKLSLLSHGRSWFTQIIPFFYRNCKYSFSKFFDILLFSFSRIFWTSFLNRIIHNQSQDGISNFKSFHKYFSIHSRWQFNYLSLSKELIVTYKKKKKKKKEGTKGKKWKKRIVIFALTRWSQFPYKWNPVTRVTSERTAYNELKIEEREREIGNPRNSQE